MKNVDFYLKSGANIGAFIEGEVYGVEIDGEISKWSLKNCFSSWVLYLPQIPGMYEGQPKIKIIYPGGHYNHAPSFDEDYPQAYQPNGNYFIPASVINWDKGVKTVDKIKKDISTLQTRIEKARLRIVDSMGMALHANKTDAAILQIPIEIDWTLAS